MPGLIKITKGAQSGTIIALTEKAGCTSMRQTLKRKRVGQLVDLNQAKLHQYPIRLYLRHPIQRFVSAWRYFYPSQFPRESGIPAHAPIEKFIDDVLRGVENEHWNPQLAMYSGCNIAEIYQFERVNDTWPSEWPLEHLNASHFSVRVPDVIPRHDELRQHYIEDLETWAGLNAT